MCVTLKHRQRFQQATGPGCEAPRAGTPLHALIKVALNGVHFVGGNPEGDASGLVYQYYQQPQLLGLTPAGGPAAGSGAGGI